MSETTRRSFLQTAGCVGGAIAACSMLPAELRALPVRFIGDADAHVDSVSAERTFPIPTSDSVNIDRGASMILVRAQGKVFAFALSCPHERAAVKWVPKDGRFQCTKHDSRYLADGKYISGRATRNLDRFPIRKDGANVVVNLDLVYRSDSDAGGWGAAEVAV